MNKDVHDERVQWPYWRLDVAAAHVHTFVVRAPGPDEASRFLQAYCTNAGEPPEWDGTAMLAFPPSFKALPAARLLRADGSGVISLPMMSGKPGTPDYDALMTREYEVLDLFVGVVGGASVFKIRR